MDRSPRIVPLALAACLVSCAPGATLRPFRTVLGGDGADVGNAIVRLEDGGFAVVGYTSSFGAGGEDVYLIRTDESGHTLWTRTYGGPGDEDGWDLARRPDGGFVISGFGNSEGAGGDDVLLMCVNAQGRLEWTRTYGGRKGERSWALTDMPDGGYVVAGQTRSWGAGDWDAYVLRVDSAGHQMWSRVFGGPGIDRALNVARTPSGDLAVTGFTTATPESDRDAFVALLSPDGRVKWNRTIHGERAEVGHGVTLDGGGTILVTGYGNSWGNGDNDVDLWSVGMDGEVAARRELGSAEVDDRAMMTAVAPDATLLVIGYIHRRAGDWDVAIWRTSPDGHDPVRLVLSNPGDDRGVFALAESSRSLVLTGAWAAGAGRPPDVILSRLILP